MKQISPAELAAWLADVQRVAPLLLDVREAWEFGICHILGSRHVPMGAVAARLSEFDPTAELVVICHHGVRSARICMFLEHQGFQKVHNLAGGVAAWADRVDPAMPQY